MTSAHLLKHHHGGWIPQRPDMRDQLFAPPEGAIPTSHLLDVTKLPKLDQGQQGSCTGHGPIGPVTFLQQAMKLKIVEPSPAFIYWNARVPEKTTDQDSGASVRDSVAGVAKWGVCPNTEFKYSDQVFNKKPSAKDFKDALLQQALVYQSVPNSGITGAIASGFPFVYGFTVYETFEGDEVAKTGVVPIPKKGESVLGGHCTYAFGYNTLATESLGIPPKSVACRNSWGPDWGDGGNFYLPLWFWSEGQASDNWIIRKQG